MPSWSAFKVEESIVMNDEVLDLYVKLLNVIVLPNEMLRNELLFCTFLTIKEAELF